VAEIHGKSVGAALPRTVLGARDLAMPPKHIGGGIGVLGRFGDKAKGMVTPPVLALLLQPVDHKLVYLLLLHRL